MMTLNVTDLIIMGIGTTTIAGFVYRRFYYSCIFHPSSYLLRTKWHTLLSSAFVHTHGAHVMLNLSLLYIFGNELEILLASTGRSTSWVLILFICSCVVSNLGNWCFHRNNISFSSLGASNGVMAILVATLLCRPYKMIKFIPFIALPNYLLIPLLLLFNLLYFFKNKIEIDCCGHIIGILCGSTFSVMF